MVILPMMRTLSKKCKASGVSVIVDTTHTAFSPLPACPDADYIAVSLRKWMGVASGGLAIKRKALLA